MRCVTGGWQIVMRGHENFLHDEAVVGLSGVWPGFAVLVCSGREGNCLVDALICACLTKVMASL